jgi:hypothetical protein
MSLSASVGVQIPTNVVEVGNEISLSAINALAAASAPSTVNPFATVAYISGFGYTTETFVTSQGYATENYVVTRGYLTDAPNNGNEYVRKNAAWAVATGGGGATAASQLTNAAYTTNPAAAPTTAGDVLQFNGTALVWAAGGGGGGVAWGGITGTVTAQTDLTSYISGLGYLTSVPSKTVNVQTSNYGLLAGDTNNILYFNSVSGSITISDDATYSFPIGTHIMVATNGCTISVIAQDTMTPAPVIQGTTSFTTGIYHLIKVAANTWVID